MKVVRTFSCARFWLQALNCSGVVHSFSPRATSVLPEAVGIEIRQSDSLERLAEDPPDGGRIAPADAFQPGRFEESGCSNFDPGRRKQGFVWPEQPLFRQERNPLGNDALDLRAYRKEC